MKRVSIIVCIACMIYTLSSCHKKAPYGTIIQANSKDYPIDTLGVDIASDTIFNIIKANIAGVNNKKGTHPSGNKSFRLINN